MWNWLAHNWGNLASVIGLALSVYAVVISRSARQAVQGFRRNRQLLELFSRTERSIDATNELLATAGAFLPKGKRDKLWIELVELQQASDDTGVSKLYSDMFLAEAISTLGTSRSLANDIPIKDFLKKVLKELIQRKNSARKLIEECL